MKKIIFTSLLLITPLCKAADYPSAMQYLAKGMTDLAKEDFFEDVADNTSLYFKAANPANLIFLDDEEDLGPLFSEENTDPLFEAILCVLNKTLFRGIDILDAYSFNKFGTILDLNGEKALCSTSETKLSLIKRQLTTIPVNINDLDLLSHLNLSDNDISTIPKNLNLPQVWDLYLENNHLQTIPDNFSHHFPNLIRLYLKDNSITTIPEDLNLPNLIRLYLNNNHIEYVNPQIINQFPSLRHLDLNQNPLTQENINEFRAAVQQSNRVIEIIANDIGDQYAPPAIKAAKK